MCCYVLSPSIFLNRKEYSKTSKWATQKMTSLKVMDHGNDGWYLEEWKKDMEAYNLKKRKEANNES